MIIATSYKCWNNNCTLSILLAVQDRGGLRPISHRSKMDNEDHEPPQKRRRLSLGAEGSSASDRNQELTHSSLSRPISPPPLRRVKENQTSKLKPSPFQLTWIRDLPETSNNDAVSLRDILCDPLISECWEFNYLHDLDFLMEAFDQDVRDLVKVHVVHGFWKNEDQSRLALKVRSISYAYIIEGHK
jgi:tyrosyl-DNA phosphodiesterase-1